MCGEAPGGSPGVRILVLMYADDVVVVLSRPDPRILVEAARLEAQLATLGLGSLRLSTSGDKLNSPIVFPNTFAGGIFRRPDSDTTKAAYGRNTNLSFIT